MFRLKSYRLMALIVVLFISLNTSYSFAHKMWVEEVETGTIQVFYADGSSPTFGDVILYSEEYIELYRGNLDEKGTFLLPPGIDAHLLVASDGTGHQVRWYFDDDHDYQTNELLKIILIAFIFIGIAVIFHIKSSKKPKVTN